MAYKENNKIDYQNDWALDIKGYKKARELFNKGAWEKG